MRRLGRHVVVCLGALALCSFASSAGAQSLPQLDSGMTNSLTERGIQVFIAVTALSLVPALAIMFTCFPFMVTVLSVLRQGLGLQQSPPNMLLISLALFLTYFVMEPVFNQVWDDAIEPVTANEMLIEDALPIAMTPFRTFMEGRIDPSVFQQLAEIRANSGSTSQDLNTASLATILPAFMLSELTRAFEVGFLIFIPFLLIDLLVSAVLMSMGMMMVPPAMVALPFKLAFFVVADGWGLLASALVQHYQ